MRRATGIVALLLLVAACGGSSVAITTSPTTVPTQPATSTPAQTTTTAPQTTTSAPPITTTSPVETTTTTTATDSDAQFVLANVTFGDGRMVVITNIGDGSGSLAGHALCQRPLYYEFPDVEVPAGQSAVVSVGGSAFSPPDGVIVIEDVAGIGPFDPTSGEVALYSSSAFSDPDAILSYVEWGGPGHPRSSVAIAAGIWPDGGFVDVPESVTEIFAGPLPAMGPDDWMFG